MLWNLFKTKKKSEDIAKTEVKTNQQKSEQQEENLDIQEKSAGNIYHKDSVNISLDEENTVKNAENIEKQNFSTEQINNNRENTPLDSQNSVEGNNWDIKDNQVISQESLDEVQHSPTETNSSITLKEENKNQDKSFFNKIKSFLRIKKKIDAHDLREIEKILIAADFGSKLTKIFLKKIVDFYHENQPSESEVQLFIKNEILSKLMNIPRNIEFPQDKINVIIMCGINGNGKTSTIGKLANKYKMDNKKVLLAACDTFRAAAVEQLSVWGEKNNVDVIKGNANSDPASVAFQACEKAIAAQVDFLLIDTAGRLHNKQGLMAELLKIKKIINKFADKIAIFTMLVIDSNTGQNADQQLEIFNNEIGLDALIFTKLDGTAKGGGIIRLTDKYHLPILAISYGEGIDDINGFDPEFIMKKIL